VALSTRQLADLAGTTLKTIRHYHDVGVLDPPERSSNGYKQYTVTHLVRVLQIKRLSDLGVFLSQIPAMSGIDEDLEVRLRELDTEIEVSIARLQQVRVELKSIMRDHASADVPAEFESVAGGLSESDRALLMVYSRVFSHEQLMDVRTMLLNRDPLGDEYDALASDADEATIESLAERYLPVMRRHLDEHPWMGRTAEFGRPRRGDGQNIVSEAVLALYNPAQRSVTLRIHEKLQREHADEATATDAPDGDITQ